LSVAMRKRISYDTRLMGPRPPAPGLVHRRVRDAGIEELHAHRADPAAEVAAQADAFDEFPTRLGNHVVADVVPSGARHLYIFFASRFPGVD